VYRTDDFTRLTEYRPYYWAYVLTV